MLCIAVAVAFAAGCGDNMRPLGEDAGATPDAAVDAASGRVIGCLDRSGIEMAPVDQLPCDLVPPGVAL